jgi:hypothetical protein
VYKKESAGAAILDQEGPRGFEKGFVAREAFHCLIEDGTQVFPAQFESLDLFGRWNKGTGLSIPHPCSPRREALPGKPQPSFG